MKVFNRLLSFLLAALFIALFYVFSVMLDTRDSENEEQFVVEMAVTPLSPMDRIESGDAQILTNAFGAPLPLPEGLIAGQVEDVSYHGARARKVSLQGEKALVTGIRPASAAPKITDRSLVFLQETMTLLGYPLSSAETMTGPVYSLITEDAAFLITPYVSGETGNFSLMQITP